MTAFFVIALLWFLAGAALVLASGYSLRQALIGGLLSLLVVLFWIATIISRSDRAEQFWNQLDDTARGRDPKISWALIWMLAIPLDLLILALGIWLSRWLIP